MKQIGKGIFYILSGTLLCIAWPMNFFTCLIFVAWIPLFIIEKSTSNPYRFFLILLLNLFIWNTGTTWWIWNASEGGAVGAIIANSLLMTLPWLLFRITKQRLGETFGYLSFFLYWITFEYIHLNWDLSWPWLTLGNVFANHPGWIRWYAYTGTTGGSCWVLIVNILLCKAIAVWKSDRSQLGSNRTSGLALSQSSFVAPVWIFFLSSLLVIVLPVLWAFIGWPADFSVNEHTPNIVIVQPNIDPYNEKFTTDASLQIDKLIRLSERKIDTNTRMVVWPETAIAVQAWENQLRTNPFYQPVYAFVKRHPHIMLVTGIDSYENHGSENAGGFSIRIDSSAHIYYEAFNTAMALDSNLNVQLYHKSKLVPGVESLPSWLSFLGKIFENFGGISGTLGRSKEPVVFSFPSNLYKPAPVICYESIYGEYVAQYVRKGANIITIITNDGWWGNTPGYQQHQSYARLRAIETGCWVIRSANTGISCFISPEGAVFDHQPWDTETAIRMQIPVVTNKTFYVRHGDWISRVIWILAAIILLITIIKNWKKKSINS